MQEPGGAEGIGGAGGTGGVEEAGGAVVTVGEEGAQGEGGAGGTGGVGGKENEGGAVKTPMLKLSLLYPIYSCGASAEGCKYSCDIVQILEPKHHIFYKTGHFQVNFEEMAFWSSEGHK